MTEPKISVGILTDKKIVFELYGDFEVDFSGKTLSGRFKCEIVNNKLVVSDKQNKYVFENEVYFAPSAPETEYFTLRDVVIGVQFHWERKEKQSFNGSLKLVIDNEKVTAVNILSIEDYLTSVISSEMSAKCTLELLKAHSVISRSWLLAQIEKSQSIKKENISYVRQIESGDELIKWYDREDHVLFDVCADDHCQRYQGTTKVFTDVARQAVSETRGLVLVDDNEAVCDTRFFKACGGVTEAFENVWEPKHFPYLVPVIDYKYEPDNYNMDLTKEANAVKWIKTSPPAFCNTTDKKVLSQVLLDYDQETTDFYRWKVEYTQAEISELINKKTGFDFGKIIDLIPVERGPSARLTKMKIVGTKKTLTIGKELEIRKVLSNSHLYSSAIVVEKEEVKESVPQRFVIFGAGWGHGVGLCQIGAAVMSENGYRFDEILMHYYKNAKMKRIY
jgi:SpoIID/LytB domain protein